MNSNILHNLKPVQKKNILQIATIERQSTSTLLRKSENFEVKIAVSHVIWSYSLIDLVVQRGNNPEIIIFTLLHC